MVVTTRADFITLTDLRLREAKLLIDQAQDWDGAYYLAGYAVEFALKARIIGGLMRTGAFPDKKLFDNFYKHDLTILRHSAGLEIEMEQDATIRAQWRIVQDWSEQSRYKFGTTEQEARRLHEAIENEVLPWIKARW